MTWFTGLARVARDAGLKVVEVPGWKTRGHGHMELPKSIIVHHTAGAKTGNYPSLAVVRDGRTGLPGPLSHYGLGRDGTVYVIAAGLCAHAGKDSQLAWAHRNVRAIGIEAENTGVGEVWPAVQLDAYVRLCRALVDEFGLDTTAVLGHKEIAPGRKIDPAGINMGDFRAWVRTGRHPSSSVTVQAAVKPITKDWLDMATEADIRKIVADELNKHTREQTLDILRYNNTSRTERDLYALVVDGGLNSAIARNSVASVQAQLSGLVGALKATQAGEPFDEAKLLAGVKAAAEAGVANAVASIETTTTVNLTKEA